MRTSAPRAFASSSEPRPPGTRSMSPKVASVTSGLLGERDRVVDAAHRDHADGAAGPVDELDLGRQQVLEPVAVDRVRVPAADLHDPHRLARLDERRDLGREPARELGRAVLVDVLHAAPRARARGPRGRAARRPAPRRGRGRSRRAPRRPPASTTAPRAVDRDDDRLDRLVGAGDAALGRSRAPSPAAARRARAAARRRAASSSSVSRASSSSIRASAKPTWISTQSPGSTGAAGSSTSATLTSRRTPEMSTLARPPSRSTTSTTWPGMPRHMTRASQLRPPPARS